MGSPELPTRTGYIFEKFTTQSGKEYKEENALDEETYFARWRPITYEVVYYSEQEPILLMGEALEASLLVEDQVVLTDLDDEEVKDKEGQEEEESSDIVETADNETDDDSQPDEGDENDDSLAVDNQDDENNSSEDDQTDEDNSTEDDQTDEDDSSEDDQDDEDDSSEDDKTDENSSSEDNQVDEDNSSEDDETKDDSPSDDNQADNDNSSEDDGGSGDSSSQENQDSDINSTENDKADDARPLDIDVAHGKSLPECIKCNDARKYVVGESRAETIDSFTSANILYRQTLTYDQSYAVKTAADLNLYISGYHLLWQREDGSLLSAENGKLFNETSKNGGVVYLKAYWEANPVIAYTSSSYKGTYDKKSHTISVSSTTQGAQITYSEDGKNFSATRPSYTKAGSYTVYFRITAPGFDTISGSEKVVISKASPSMSLTAANGFIGVSSSNTDSISISAKSSDTSIAKVDVGGSGDGSNTAIPKYPIRVVPTPKGASGKVTISVWTEATENYSKSEVKTVTASIGSELNKNKNKGFGTQGSFNSSYGWYYGTEADGAWNKKLKWSFYDSDQWLTTMPIALGEGTYFVQNYTGKDPRNVCWNTNNTSSAYAIFSANDGYMLTVDQKRYLQLCCYVTNAYSGTMSAAKASPSYFAENKDYGGKYMTVRKVSLKAN